MEVQEISGSGVQGVFKKNTDVVFICISFMARDE
jgi:hypothetical protein